MTTLVGLVAVGGLAGVAPDGVDPAGVAALVMSSRVKATAAAGGAVGVVAPSPAVPAAAGNDDPAAALPPEKLPRGGC